MKSFAFLAETLRYPAPGRLESLQSGLHSLPDSAARRACSDFLRHVSTLSLSQWEELYTHTLDLNPAAAPYVGFQIWGESYQRGKFLSQLNHVMMHEEIDLDGELPDHLIPVLRYLEIADEPLYELVEVLKPALEKMQAALRKSQPDNPYIGLLGAVKQAASQLSVAEAL